MKVWVLRHGEAEPHAARDDQRHLTAHGREQVLRSTAHLLGQPLEAIFASPYVRAQQTAQLVRGALAFDKAIETVSWLTPETDPRQVAGELEILGVHNVLLVSHQPLVGRLVGWLGHGSLQHREPMDTASLAELEGDAPLAGLMSLRHLHHA